MSIAGIAENEIEAIVRLAWQCNDFPTFKNHVALLKPETHGVIMGLSPMILDVLFQIANKGIEKGLVEAHGRYEL